jgi:WD40 repeat protein
MGAAFLSSGPGIVSVDDGGLRFWTVDGSRLRPSRRLAAFPNSSSIRSSHGMLALADQSDGLVHLLREDGRGGERTLRAAPLTSNVYAASFSPDGRRLVTAGQQARIRIWRVSDGRLLQTLPPVPGTTFSAEFSPDGGSVITGGVDGAVRIWNAATGRAIAVLREHAAAVDAASFSPDGRWILSAGDDRTARIYSCEPCAGIERLRTLAHDRTSRDLTAEEIMRYGGG